MEQLVQAMRNMQEGGAQTVTSMRQVETCVQRLQELDQRLVSLRERLTGGNQTGVVPAQSSLAEAA